MFGLRSSIDLLLGKRPPAMQVGAICRSKSTGKVLLITSRGTGRWIIPKGWPMEGRSLADAALQEAWEEGGVKGVIAQREMGRYHYGKAQDSGFAVPVEVRVFLIEVDELFQDFPESDERQRQWYHPVDAAKLVDEPELADILARLGQQHA